MNDTMFWCVSCLLSSLLIAAARSNQAPARDLVQVTLKGTAIDVFPDAIQVVVDDPEEAAKRLEKKGGQRVSLGTDGPSVVAYRGVTYYFGKAEAFNRVILDHAFKLGDVIYIILSESEEEVRSFVEKYKLTKYATIRLTTLTGHIRREVYVGKPGYYVRFPLKVICYACPVHAEVVVDLPGFCPLCESEFAEVQVYR